MFQLFSRICWIVSITIGIAVFAIDNDLFILGVIATIFVRFFLLSDRFIHERVRFFADKLSQRAHQEGQNKILTPIQSNSIDESNQEIETETGNSTINQEEIKGDSFSNQSTTQALKDEKKIQESREPNILEKFFSENILAKIGGIIVFLGVLFFLSAIYAAVGPVAKIVIGFIFGFGIFASGVWLDKKGWDNEGRIVMGIGILINYLVILSGRHILGNDASTNTTLLSVTSTFIFLILNTVFAITTALVYNSRTLLIFAFVFAYINPLLLGTSSSEPYTLLGYTLIVTLGAQYMAYKTKDEVLFPLSFIFASILFLIAPWSDAWGWIAKLICVNILGALSLYVSTIFKKYHQFTFEILIGSTFFLIGLIGLLGLQDISSLQLLLLGVSSLSLMSFCYISMHKGMYLYSIGTLGSILTLSPALIISGTQSSHISISVIIIGFFALLNLGILLVRNTELLSKNNTGNITVGLLSGSAFLTAMIYVFGNEYFPGMMQGFVILGLAATYCLLSILIVQKIGISNLKTSPETQNIFYVISGIGISLFTLAIAFVFAERKEIISIVWLLEASVLFYLSSKINSYKISLGAVILFIIGIFRLLPFIDTNLTGNYGMIVAIAIVTLTLLYNTWLLYSNPNERFSPVEIRTLHNVFHIIGVGSATILFYNVIENLLSDWETFWYFATSITLIMIFYACMKAVTLRMLASGVYILLLLAHIMFFGSEVTSSYNNISIVEILISTCIIITFALPYVFERVSFKKLEISYIFPLYLIYLFVISTLYVYHFFPNTFSVTIYWGILAFIILKQGIDKNIQPWRTVGLYLIILTTIKIFFNDIWVGISNEAIQFLALMIVGILMIVLSTMYTKRFGNTMNSEFNLSNLFSQNKKTNSEKAKHTPQATDSSQAKDTGVQIQQDLDAIDISNISGVRMYISQDKTVQIRAQNLIRIAKLICEGYNKTEFQAGELKREYELISQNYKSTLSPSQYKKIKEIVKLFVDKGGKIDFIKK